MATKAKPSLPPVKEAEIEDLSTLTAAATDEVVAAVEPSEAPGQTVTSYVVTVKKSWPYGALQAAGIIFPGKGATRLNVNDPALPELRSNPYLTVKEAFD